MRSTTSSRGPHWIISINAAPVVKNFLPALVDKHGALLARLRGEIARAVAFYIQSADLTSAIDRNLPDPGVHSVTFHSMSRGSPTFTDTSPATQLFTRPETASARIAPPDRSTDSAARIRTARRGCECLRA